jgi:hypothetical protein
MFPYEYLPELTDDRSWQSSESSGCDGTLDGRRLACRLAPREPGTNFEIKLTMLLTIEDPLLRELGCSNDVAVKGSRFQPPPFAIAS